MKPAVLLKGVTRTFGQTEVLKGIDLSVAPGQVVAIYGRSGSGKTTLLNLVGGLDRPTAGAIEVDGVDLGRLSDEALTQLRRQRIAFVFQSYGLLAHLTAWENVIFALRLAGCPRSAWQSRAAEALDAGGLTGRAHHLPGALSGGEQQRVAIARALAVQPRLILADEPTGALDHTTGHQIIDLLVHFAHRTGATIWLVTHDLSVRERVDQAYQISDGRLSPEQGEEREA